MGDGDGLANKELLLSAGARRLLGNPCGLSAGRCGSRIPRRQAASPPLKAVAKPDLELEVMMVTGTRPLIAALGIAAMSLALGGVQDDPELHRAIGMALHNVRGDFSRVPDGPFNDRNHVCIGEKATVALGADRIRQLGITTQSAIEVLGAPPLTRRGLTEDEIDRLLDAIDECIPFQDIWVFLAMTARNTEKLIKTEQQRGQLTTCLAATPGRQAVRDAWRVLFTQPTEAFTEEFERLHGESMTCYAKVFCGPAYVGAVITPGLFQTMITKGACPF